MGRAMSTIDFCEKSLKKADYDSSVYDKGSYGNLCEVMGPNPLFWLLPLSMPAGLFYIDEKTSLSSAAAASSAAQRRASALAVEAAAQTSMSPYFMGKSDTEAEAHSNDPGAESSTSH